jgi:phosphoribosylanthranilate isomerase
MMVKICGITRREDAEAAAAAGASAIGFVFVPSSPRFVTAEAAVELARGLPLWKVGVFAHQPAASIEAIARAAQLDVVQVYGPETPRLPRLWRAFRVPHGVDLQPAHGAEALLLDGPANGQGFDWTAARGLAPKVIVAGGLNPANVAEAIRIARPWGVDASSGLEIAPGIKDPEKIRRFVDAARRAAQEAA